MTKSLGIKLGIAGFIIFVGIIISTMYININDTANTKLQEIDGYKAKVEVSLDEMNKTIKQLSQATKGEKEAFLKFQSLVADSKKGQSLGGVKTQIKEKYQGFDNLMRNIEGKRDEFALLQEDYNDRVAQYNMYIVKVLNKIFLSGKHVKLDQFVVSSTKAKASMT